MQKPAGAARAACGPAGADQGSDRRRGRADHAGLADLQGQHSRRQSDILVENLEANGAVVYAKSNTPEFGAGANTFNEVFGATLNPWDTSRSAAGSSGGAAVALATGMAWLAHGSDMGGSLRNPASFCGIVGMRPSIGRVAHTPDVEIDRNLGVAGPMARNVEDLALLLDAMSGDHPADPLSLPRAADLVPVGRALRLASRSASPTRPISASRRSIPRSRRSPARRRERFAEAGAIVEEAHPDCARRMNASTCCARFDFAISKAAAAARPSATCSSPR